MRPQTPTNRQLFGLGHLEIGDQSFSALSQGPLKLDKEDMPAKQCWLIAISGIDEVFSPHPTSHKVQPEKLLEALSTINDAFCSHEDPLAVPILPPVLSLHYRSYLA